MKKVMLLVGCLVVVFAAFAIKPPKVVKEAFTSKYARAIKVQWEKGNAVWDAKFELNEKKCFAIFDDNGNWLETNTELPINFLPSPVAAAVKERFEGAAIESVNKIERANEGSQYDAGISLNGEKKEVIFSENGQFIKEGEKGK